MRSLLVVLLRVYQRLLSPLKPPTCRFHPSCSEYAIQALRQRGVCAGLLLMTLRLLRCNPFCRGGYDPVPERGFRAFGAPEAVPADPRPGQSRRRRDHARTP